MTTVCLSGWIFWILAGVIAEVAIGCHRPIPQITASVMINTSQPADVIMLDAIQAFRNSRSVAMCVSSSGGDGVEYFRRISQSAPTQS